MGRLCRAGYISPLKRPGGQAQVVHHDVVGHALLRVARRNGVACLHLGDDVPEGAAVRPARITQRCRGPLLALLHSVPPFLSGRSVIAAVLVRSFNHASKAGVLLSCASTEAGAEPRRSKDHPSIWFRSEKIPQPPSTPPFHQRTKAAHSAPVISLGQVVDFQKRRQRPSSRIDRKSVV